MEQLTEDVQFLVQSPNRGELLCVLATEAPCDRYDIEAEVDATRRTVVRNLNELTDRGYVTETEAGYRLTAFGAFLADVYDEFTTDTALADRLGPFLEHVSANLFDLDPRLLADADVLTASEASPYAVLDRTLELRRQSSRIREIAPAVEKKSVEQLAERVRNGEDVEMLTVIPARAAEEATTNPDYRDDHLAALRADTVEMHAYPERIPLFVGVLDDTVALSSAKDGRPNALVTTTNPTVREWAEETIADFVARARPHTAE